MNRFLLGFAMLVASTFASAACVTKDLGGNWQTFVADPNLGWSSCQMTMKTNGKVKSGACKDSYGGSTVYSGKLKITSACEVSGSLNISGTVNKINAARMTGDQSQITGIVTIGGIPTDFAAVRY